MKPNGISDFIALHPPNPLIPVVVIHAGALHFLNQFVDCMLGQAGHADNGIDAAAFYKSSNDLGPLLEV
jgi:hypothetical protein